MHFDRLRVGAFRGLTDLDLEFAGVTLVGGDTGTGRSSLLEAVGLALRPTDPGQWVSTALRRHAGPNAVVDGIVSMFSLSHTTGQPSSTIKLGLKSGGMNRRVSIVAKGYQGGEQFASLQLGIDVDGDESTLQFPTTDGQSLVSMTVNSTLVHTLGSTIFPKGILDGVRSLARQQPAYQACVQRLLNCVDDTIHDVRLQGGAIQLLQRGRWVDLMMLGDGLRRVLGLAMMVVRCSRGVLLVDGLENYLHHSRLAKLTKTLLNIAETLQIQLVLVTDSLDVIDAVLSANEELGAALPLNMHWLQRHSSVVKVRTYDQEMLGRLRDGGLDVR